jgi:hypothetical protein
MPQTQTKSKLEEELKIAQESQEKAFKDLNLVFPEDIKPEQRHLWEDFFRMLIRGVQKNVVDVADLRDFEKKFYSLSDSDKEVYTMKLYSRIDESVFVKNESLQAIDEVNFKQNLELAKSKVPDNLKPVIDFIAYSIKLRQPLPEGLIEELELALSPEGQEAQIQQNLQKTIDQYRRNPLNAGKMAQGANFNQPYSREQVAKILDEAQGLPTKRESQRIQPRSQAPLPNQQARRSTPNIEFVQSSMRPNNQMPRMPSPIIQQNIPKKNTPSKNNPPVMRQAMKMPVAKTPASGVDQTKSLLDQTSGVNKHNKGLDELL